MATGMARHMVTQYGMSQRLGLASFEQPAGSMLYPGVGERQPYSERTAQGIDFEIATLLSEAHERVRQTLLEKRPLLDAVAHALLEHETLDRRGLERLISEHSAGVPVRRVGTSR
jgi:cell division protease FtsH